MVTNSVATVNWTETAVFCYLRASSSPRCFRLKMAWCLCVFTKLTTDFFTEILTNTDQPWKRHSITTLLTKLCYWMVGMPVIINHRVMQRWISLLHWQASEWSACSIQKCQMLLLIWFDTSVWVLLWVSILTSVNVMDVQCQQNSTIPTVLKYQDSYSSKTAPEKKPIGNGKLSCIP